MISLNLAVDDIIRLLPRDPTYVVEPMGSTILGLTYHHGAGPQNAYGIAQYHVTTLLWGRIAYHFVIEEDGKIEMTLSPNERGAHAGYTLGDNLDMFPNKDKQWYNDHYYSCVLAGDFTHKPPKVAQLTSAVNLGVAFKQATNGLAELVGHRELPGKATTCPALLDMTWLRVTVDERWRGLESPLVTPGSGDEAYFRQFPNWRAAAISLKGTADLFGTQLVKTREYLERAKLLKEDDMLVTNNLLEQIERVIGKQ